MFCALGFHRFFPIRSNEYKNEDEGGGLEIPPQTMETDSVIRGKRIVLLSLETMVLWGRHKGGLVERRLMT